MSKQNILVWISNKAIMDFLLKSTDCLLDCLLDCLFDCLPGTVVCLILLDDANDLSYNDLSCILVLREPEPLKKNKK